MGYTKISASKITRYTVCSLHTAPSDYITRCTITFKYKKRLITTQRTILYYYMHAWALAMVVS